MNGGYLLDTNLISEPWRVRPDSRVMAWLAAADEDQCFLSVVTIAEIRLGIEILADGRRRRALAAWLDQELVGRFDRRILSVDRQTADAWGQVVARGRAAGAPVGIIDGFLAATAQVHGLTLVARNTRDFQRLGIPLLDPWRA